MREIMSLFGLFDNENGQYLHFDILFQKHHTSIDIQN